MFGHSFGKDVGEKIMKSLKDDGLDCELLLALSSDGPNVNKTIWKTVDATKKAAGYPGLVDIGSCYIHVVHNSFAKAKETFSNDVEELAIDLFTYFKQSSARREDYNDVQIDIGVEEHMFQRHVSSRWLTLAPVVGRILEQWDVIQQYI